MFALIGTLIVGALNAGTYASSMWLVCAADNPDAYAIDSSQSVLRRVMELFGYALLFVALLMTFHLVRDVATWL